MTPAKQHIKAFIYSLDLVTSSLSQLCAFLMLRDNEKGLCLFHLEIFIEEVVLL